MDPEYIISGKNSDSDYFNGDSKFKHHGRVPDHNKDDESSSQITEDPNSSLSEDELYDKYHGSDDDSWTRETPDSFDHRSTKDKSNTHSGSHSHSSSQQKSSESDYESYKLSQNSTKSDYESYKLSH